MAVAVHEGGPADGAQVTIEGRPQPQVRYWAPEPARKADGWVDLARYVFVPPRDGKWCRYTYTGVQQVRGPVPSTDAEKAPGWS